MVEKELLMECQCCFLHVAFDECTHCNSESTWHFFCKQCARSAAEAQIGLQRYKLSCLYSGHVTCDAEFDKYELPRFLDQKTIDLLSKLEQQESLRIADIKDLVKCPWCDYAEIRSPSDPDQEFRCLHPACLKKSCRLCQKEAHFPRPCSEVADKDYRHVVEEAMTEAVMRKCNKCKIKFLKSYGCNRMTCPVCGHKQCYICSADVTEYTHFDD
ncbi:hypothetical protein BZA77DRAFT_251734, partial [Pyronema omphalodes]